MSELGAVAILPQLQHFFLHETQMTDKAIYLGSDLSRLSRRPASVVLKGGGFQDRCLVVTTGFVESADNPY
jgi:hypothetical protein